MHAKNWSMFRALLQWLCYYPLILQLMTHHSTHLVLLIFHYFLLYFMFYFYLLCRNVDFPQMKERGCWYFIWIFISNFNYVLFKFKGEVTSCWFGMFWCCWFNLNAFHIVAYFHIDSWIWTGHSTLGRDVCPENAQVYSKTFLSLARKVIKPMLVEVVKLYCSHPASSQF